MHLHVRNHLWPLISEEGCEHFFSIHPCTYRCWTVVERHSKASPVRWKGAGKEGKRMVPRAKAEHWHFEKSLGNYVQSLKTLIADLYQRGHPSLWKFKLYTIFYQWAGPQLSPTNHTGQSAFGKTNVDKSELRAYVYVAALAPKVGVGVVSLTGKDDSQHNPEVNHSPRFPKPSFATSSILVNSSELPDKTVCWGPGCKRPWWNSCENILLGWFDFQSQ